MNMTSSSWLSWFAMFAACMVLVAMDCRKVVAGIANGEMMHPLVLARHADQSRWIFQTLQHHSLALDVSLDWQTNCSFDHVDDGNQPLHLQQFHRFLNASNSSSLGAFVDATTRLGDVCFEAAPIPRRESFLIWSDDLKTPGFTQHGPCEVHVNDRLVNQFACCLDAQHPTTKRLAIDLSTCGRACKLAFYRMVPDHQSGAVAITKHDHATCPSPSSSHLPSSPSNQQHTGLSLQPSALPFVPSSSVSVMSDANVTNKTSSSRCKRSASDSSSRSASSSGSPLTPASTLAPPLPVAPPPLPLPPPPPAVPPLPRGTSPSRTSSTTPTALALSVVATAAPSASQKHSHKRDKDRNNASIAGASGNGAAFNVALAMQNVLARDIMSLAQRMKMAQQLDSHLRQLSWTPTLFPSYEPFLQPLLDLLNANTKAAKELQRSVMTILQLIASHNPRKAIEWINQHVQLYNESLCLEWSFGLLLEAEKRVPVHRDANANTTTTASTSSKSSPVHHASGHKWSERTMEFLEFDAAIGRAFQLWRSILDRTADERCVDKITGFLMALGCQLGEPLRRLMHKRIQPHFVDIADVLIGWAMNSVASSELRENIIRLLENLGALWNDNSVFSLQLLESFADDIKTLCKSCPLNHDEHIKMNTLVVCFLMLVHCVPHLVVDGSSQPSSLLLKVLDCVVTCNHSAFSMYCVFKSAGYLTSIHQMPSQSPFSLTTTSLLAIEFLLVKMTALSTRHDTALADLCVVLVDVKKLLSTHTPNDQTTRKATRLLSDPIALGHRRNQKRLIFETLLPVQTGSFTRELAGVTTMLIRLGGTAALKVALKNAFNAPKNGSKMWSDCFDFWLLCVAISIESLNKDQIESVTPSILDDALGFLQSASTASVSVWFRHIARTLKVLSKLVRQQSRDSKSSKIKSESVAGLLEFTLNTLPNQIPNSLAASRVVLPSIELMDAFVQCNSLPTEHLEAFVSKLCKRLSNLVRCPYDVVCNACLHLLSALVTRYGHLRVIVPVLEMTLDQTWDKTISSMTLDTISKAATASVLLRTPKRHPLHVNYGVLSPKFTGADFQRVVQVLGDMENNLAKSFEVFEATWSRISDRSASSGFVPPNNMLPPRYAWKILNVVRQAAMWCISSRLRTHFGGAAQTFASIERLLQKQAVDSYWMPWAQPSRAISRYLTVYFVGILEFNIFLVTNGGEAACLEMDKTNDEANKATIGFFKTNKKVCDGWLLRIRPLLVEISKSTTPDLLCYHANELFFSLHRKLTRIVNSEGISGKKPEAIRELHDAESELDSALFSLCVAYADLKDGDSIRSLQTISNGLMEYVKKRVGFSQQRQDFLTWTEALLCEAKLRYEDAAALYENLLEPIFVSREGGDFYQTDLPQILCNLDVLATRVPDLVRRCAHCYLATRSWSALREFLRKLIGTMDGCCESMSPTNEVCRELASCADVWRQEVEVVGALEAVEMSASSDSQLPTGDTAPTLGKWQLIDDSERKSLATRTALGDLELLHSSSNYLRVLALDPRLFNPSAGESVAVSVEEALLRVACAGTKDPGAIQLAAVINRNLIKQQPSIHSIKQFSRLCLSETELKGDLEHRFVLETARSARKRRNFDLCDRLLDLVERTSSATLGYWTLYERACLLEQQGQVVDGYSMLWQLCHEEFRRCDGHEMSCTNNLREKLGEPIGEASVLYGKCLLRISQGLAKSRVECGDIQELHSYTETMIKPQCKQKALTQPSDNEMIMGRMLHVASLILPTNSKAWLRYGHWCYRQAKREIEAVSHSGGLVTLEESESDQIDELFNRFGVDAEKAVAMVRELCLLLEDGTMVHERRVAFESVCTERFPGGHHWEIREELMKLFDQLRSRVFYYHRLAVRVYGNFLQVASSSCFSASLTSQCLVVSLRLLRLLVKYGSEPVLETILRELFASSPISPWCRIVPQLFAHLSHPNGSVSSVVCMILKRIAHHSPHLVVYPAVVNTLSRSPVPDSTRSFEYLQIDEVHRELRETSKAFVNEIEVFVSELKRISVLWDEAWAMGLMKVSSDVSRRLSTLEQEASRVAKNPTLSDKDKNALGKRKFVAIMRPVLVSLEKLWNETGARASAKATLTPHERTFMCEYGDMISSGLARFRQYCSLDSTSSIVLDDSLDVAALPQVVWGPFVEVMNKVTAVVSRRGQIPIQEISPSIDSIASRACVINMPGALVKSSAREGGFEPVLIRNSDSKVMVLRTKTKPKTLEFVGSDGRRYRFLLKAREDLHLDERIMQFLKIVNDFLRADKQAASRNLNALNYNVTPLSNDAGLIQMVPDVIPLFQVYTNWSEPGRNRLGPNAAPVNPPTTAFYAKLEQYGIANASPMHRGHWPIALLKRVYKELAGQLPRHILRNEMLLRSSDMQEHRSKMCSFSRSMAVMSVLGYIIGLGDRHLDNILLCKKSGEIVHIDYNICFEKGLKLKVPEIVPFRLTPMLQDALGVGGVDEGSKFRIALENTLRVVRSVDSRETLLTLLEAFVYDPLIDWKKEEDGNGAASLRSRLDANVNLSLFLSRAEERRQATSDFQTRFDSLMSSFCDQLVEVQTVFAPALSQSVALENLYQRQGFLSGRVDEATKRFQSVAFACEAQNNQLLAANHQLQEMTAKIESFVEECKVRNERIVHWRERCRDLQQNLSVSAGVNSFEALRRNLVAWTERVGGLDAITLRNSFLELQHRCLSVDAEISVFEDQFKQIYHQLVPFLQVYASIWERMDEFLCYDQGFVENVYTTWTRWCSEFLQLVQQADVPQAQWHLTQISNAVNSLPQRLGFGSSHSVQLKMINQVKQRMEQKKQTLDKTLQENSALHQRCQSLEESIDSNVQQLVGELANMKLSNAQSQRLMKLAGVAWLMQTCRSIRSGVQLLEEGPTLITLQQPPGIMSMRAKLDATSVLVELVSIPKGSLKHFHAKEMVSSVRQGQTDKSHQSRKGSMLLVALQGVMGALEAQVAQGGLIDEVLKTLLAFPSRQKLQTMRRLADLLQVETNRGEFDVQGFFESLKYLSQRPPAETTWRARQGIRQELMPLLAECRSCVGFFEPIERLAQAVAELNQALGKPWNEVEDVHRVVCVQWIQVMAKILSVLVDETETAEQLDAAHDKALACVNNSMETLVNTHVVAHFQEAVACIVEHDWRLALGDIDDAIERGSSGWAELHKKELVSILPATHASSTIVDLHDDIIVHTLTHVMQRFEQLIHVEYQRIHGHQIQKLVDQVLRTIHCRVVLNEWTQDQPLVESAVILPSATDTDLTGLHRSKLLGILGSFEQQVGSLLVQIQPWESHVLELAQQMEYLAVQMVTCGGEFGHLMEPNASEQVQVCYASACHFFEQIRQVANALGEIPTIELSRRDTVDMTTVERSNPFEVDAMGQSLLSNAFHCFVDVAQQQASVSLAQEEVSKAQLDLNQANAAREELQNAIASQEQDLLVMKSLENLAVVEQVMAKANELIGFFKCFEKSRLGHQTTPIPMAGRPQPSPPQGSTDGKSAMDHANVFSFSENERLVKILLHNIKAANFLGELTQVLKHHEANATQVQQLIGAVSSSLLKLLQQESCVTQLRLMLERQSQPKQPSFLQATQASMRSPTDQMDQMEMERAAARNATLLFVKVVESIRRLLQELKVEPRSLLTSGNGNEALPQRAQLLVEECLQLFFKATAMASEFSRENEAMEQADVRGESGTGEDDDNPLVNDVDEQSESLSGDEERETEMVTGEAVGRASSPRTTATMDGLPKNAAGGGGQQKPQKNRYGLQILRRVEEKLDGKVFAHEKSGSSATALRPHPYTASAAGSGLPSSSFQVLSVQQQADWLIQEATKMDNLCVMYEGWTPWI